MHKLCQQRCCVYPLVGGENNVPFCWDRERLDGSDMSNVLMITRDYRRAGTIVLRGGRNNLWQLCVEWKGVKGCESALYV